MATIKRPVPGDQHHGTGQYSFSQFKYNGRFPTCKLHGTKIITEFPQSCLYREKYPSKRLLEFKNLGYSYLSIDGDHAGLSLLAVHDNCNQCVSRIGNHPHIVELKRKAG